MDYVVCSDTMARFLQLTPGQSMCFPDEQKKIGVSAMKFFKFITLFINLIIVAVCARAESILQDLLSNGVLKVGTTED